jgi:predicted nucleic acid-binding protein
MPLVSDTTALRYLIEIEAVHLLPVLFGQVTIPPEVAAELQRPKTPVLVRAWMAVPPSWLIIRQPTLPPDPRLRRLHAGERDALLLMYEAAAPLFLTDDGSAYKVALAQNIPVIRTLRVLEMAAEQGLIDLPAALTRLAATTFYAPNEVMVELRIRDALRKAAAQQPPPETQET